MTWLRADHLEKGDRVRGSTSCRYPVHLSSIQYPLSSPNQVLLSPSTDLVGKAKGLGNE